MIKILIPFLFLLSSCVSEDCITSIQGICEQPSQAEKDKYKLKPPQKPGDCSEVIDVLVFWNPEGQMDWKPVGYNLYFGMFPGLDNHTDEFPLAKKERGAEFPSLKRGRSYYFTIAAMNRRGYPNYSRQGEYKALTCKELEEKYKEDPWYDDSQNLELRWRDQ